MKDYYKILQVDKKASDIEIKKSFRVLALTLHPDKNKEPNAHDKFIELNEAYQILSDPSKRTRYDSVYNYLVLNKKRAKKPGTADIEDFNKWTEEGRNTGKKYANYGFSEFAKDAFADLTTNALIEGLADGIGSIIESAGDALENLFDITD